MRTCPTCKVKYPDNVTFCLRDGTPLGVSDEFSEGAVVRGKYRILGKTGHGDMSTLYKALHLRLDEVRELKIMNAELAHDPLFLKRFEQEALQTRKLQHPNVVLVEDIDETEDGRPFMVMEYIEGKRLKEALQESGPLPAPRVCAIARQIASALDAAHQLGMIHRDLKPENIELIQTPSGEVAKVLEFGSAKLKEARVGQSDGMMTLSGALAVIGTPQYMSPELAMGKRGDELDGRSDIYTLGIVMYEMLTGALPFKSGTMMHMIMSHVQAPPAPIQTVRPDVKIPEPLAALVMKCLEKDRESRPASAKALVEELDRIAGQLPAQAVATEAKPPADAAPPPKPAAPVPTAPAISQPPAPKLTPPPPVPIAASKPLATVAPQPPKPAIVPTPATAIPQPQAPKAAAVTPLQAEIPKPEVLPPPPKPSIAGPPEAKIPRPPAPEPPPPAPAIPVAPSLVDAEVERPYAPSVAAASAPPTAQRSRSVAIVLALSAIIAVGIGVWYVTSRSRNQGAVAPATTPAPGGGGAKAARPQAQPAASQPSAAVAAPGNTASQPTGGASVGQPSAQAAVAQPAPAAQPGPQAAGASTSEAASGSGETAGAVASARAAKTRKASLADIAEQVRAAAGQGDLYYDNGEYDKALREYEKGLKLDPSNTLLRQKMLRAQKAKATEDALK